MRRRRMRLSQWGIIAVILLAASVWLNPDQPSFVRFLEGATEFRQGVLVGKAVGALARIQSLTGLGLWRYNFFIFSVVQYGDAWFLGAFGIWIPIGVNSVRQVVMGNEEQTEITAVKFLALANLLVYGLWKVVPARTMCMHFEISTWNLKRAPWCLLLANFSHENLVHLILNLQVLGLVGPDLEIMLGAKELIFLYLIGGIGAQIFSLTGNSLINRTAFVSQGASGAIFAFLACQALLSAQKNIQIQMYGLQTSPVHLLAFRLFLDLLLATQNHTDVFAHIGGMLVGSAYTRFKILR